MSVRDLISLHEGRVPHAYLDSLGFWTIGVGHLIDRRKGGKIPDRIIDDLLDIDIKEHSEQLLDELPWIERLDPVRRAVLIDMHFNLGRGLLAFTETLRHFQESNWPAAAEAMLDSKWARQVGPRATRLAQMVRTGEWPK